MLSNEPTFSTVELTAKPTKAVLHNGWSLRLIRLAQPQVIKGFNQKEAFFNLNRNFSKHMKKSEKQVVSDWIKPYENHNNTTPNKVGFCDVTLRDGQQQRANELNTSERVQIFDYIIETGVDRIEIGHLGNDTDQKLAIELIKHIAEKELSDDRYANVKIQVLFGSQKEIIEDGCAVLSGAYQQVYGDDWHKVMADKTIVHVYDRLDPNLRKTSSEPYTDTQAANRVAIAAQQAVDSGFRQFSISGEAATAVSPETAINFYRSITDKLFDYGAHNVNINLANTYGYSQNSLWNAKTLEIFNRAVKHGYGGKVSTSIHSHNDVNSSAEFSMAALVGGFDIVESTHIGMGERAGNVATVDVMSRVIEQAIHNSKQEKQFKKSSIAKVAASFMLNKTIIVDPQIVENLHNYYNSGQKIAEMFGPDAMYRWQRTPLGSEYSHDNGSGPHDQAMSKTIVDPINNPADGHYEWNTLPNDILGRPGAGAIAVGNPAWVDKVTVGNHASGGKTKAIKDGALLRPTDIEVSEATFRYNKRKHKTISRLLGGITIYI